MYSHPPSLPSLHCTEVTQISLTRRPCIIVVRIAHNQTVSSCAHRRVNKRRKPSAISQSTIRMPPNEKDRLEAKDNKFGQVPESLAVFSINESPFRCIPSDEQLESLPARQSRQSSKLLLLKIPSSALLVLIIPLIRSPLDSLVSNACPQLSSSSCSSSSIFSK